MICGTLVAITWAWAICGVPEDRLHLSAIVPGSVNFATPFIASGKTAPGATVKFWAASLTSEQRTVELAAPPSTLALPETT